MYRTKLDIFREILSTCQKPTLKYRIMYGCALSYKYMCKSLDELLSKGFIEMKTNPHRLYLLTTKKGEALLKALNEAHSLLSL